MKTRSILICLVIASLLAYGAIAMADSTPGTGIAYTAHDLRKNGPGASYGDDNEFTGQNRICIYCHAPHHTVKPDNRMNYVPLWNHVATAVTDYTMYTNGTLYIDNMQHASSAMAYANQPGGVSLLCLSCHDGSVATNEYGIAPSSSVRTGTQRFVTGTSYQIGGGKDLSNHHPIGFDYDLVASEDDEIRPSSETGFLQGDQYGAQPTGPQTISDLLVDGQMECVSCHDVHNTKNGGPKFTWVDDHSSRLCLTCHMKIGTDGTESDLTLGGE